MKAGGRALPILLSAAALLASCVTGPTKAVVEPAEPQAVEQPAEAQTDQAVVETEAAPAATFVATEDLYRKTFTEVQEVIAALTRIIAADDYDQWLTYLTADYVRTTGSAQFLADASKAGILRKSGVVLKSLEDYFDKVVVPSRLQATLDDITFVDETHVKAITRVQGAPVILYYLVREEGRWKVGVLPDGNQQNPRGTAAQ